MHLSFLSQRHKKGVHLDWVHICAYPLGEFLWAISLSSQPGGCRKVPVASSLAKSPHYQPRVVGKGSASSWGVWAHPNEVSLVGLCQWLGPRCALQSLFQEGACLICISGSQDTWLSFFCWCHMLALALPNWWVWRSGHCAGNCCWAE